MFSARGVRLLLLPFTLYFTPSLCCRQVSARVRVELRFPFRCIGVITAICRTKQDPRRWIWHRRFHGSLEGPSVFSGYAQRCWSMVFRSKSESHSKITNVDARKMCNRASPEGDGATNSGAACEELNQSIATTATPQKLKMARVGSTHCHVMNEIVHDVGNLTCWSSSSTRQDHDQSTPETELEAESSLRRMGHACATLSAESIRWLSRGKWAGHRHQTLS